MNFPGNNNRYDSAVCRAALVSTNPIIPLRTQGHEFLSGAREHYLTECHVVCVAPERDSLWEECMEMRATVKAQEEPEYVNTNCLKYNIWIARHMVPLRNEERTVCATMRIWVCDWLTDTKRCCRICMKYQTNISIPVWTNRAGWLEAEKQKKVWQFGETCSKCDSTHPPPFYSCIDYSTADADLS